MAGKKIEKNNLAIALNVKIKTMFQNITQIVKKKFFF